jgi:hypothetical protein
MYSIPKILLFILLSFRILCSSVLFGQQGNYIGLKYIIRPEDLTNMKIQRIVPLGGDPVT